MDRAKVEELYVTILNLRGALKHIESVCVAGLTHEEAQNTITWVRECAREALETEV